MIAGNIHGNRKGMKVRGLDTRHRRRAVDFPGWGADNYADFLLPIPQGLTGTVTSVESHGSNPWTRYSVRFDDGTAASGLAEGTDIEFADDVLCTCPAFHRAHPHHSPARARRIPG